KLDAHTLLLHQHIISRLVFPVGKVGNKTGELQVWLTAEQVIALFGTEDEYHLFGMRSIKPVYLTYILCKLNILKIKVQIEWQAWRKGLIISYHHFRPRRSLLFYIGAYLLLGNFQRIHLRNKHHPHQHLEKYIGQ